jgi:GWxTD domain-containing protein
MTFLRRAALAAVIAYAASAFAALSPQHQEWASGPVQWIMTADEQRQWKQLATDDDAEKFIQLFWARRDPTPGTPLNEFKADFEARVKDADERYAIRDSIGTVITRGAMSDRGRVLLVLGYPQTLNRAARDLLKSSGAREIWLWEKESAKQKFDLPSVEVVFVEDMKMIFHRDTQRHDFLNATPVAIRKMIVSPDLKEVPDWAKPGAVAAAPAVNALRKGQPGAHHLLLLKDPHAIVNSLTADPFADVVTASVFAKQDDLAYAVEYCGEKDTVNVSFSIRGMSGGKKVNIGAAPVAAHLDPIPTVPGCGMLRAAISLADLPLTPGPYTFTVKLDDGTQSYNLTQDFRIE